MGIGGEFSIAHMPETNLTQETYRSLFMKCSSRRNSERLVFTSEIPRQWREEVVKEVAALVGFQVIPLASLMEKRMPSGPRLYILPLFDYTERLADMHPAKILRGNKLEEAHYRNATYHTCDPTHYCYSPLHFEPIIHGLFKIIQAADSTTVG